MLCVFGNSLTSGIAESSGARSIVYATRGLSVKPDGGHHLLHHHCAKGIYDLRLFTTNTYPSFCCYVDVTLSDKPSFHACFTFHDVMSSHAVASDKHSGMQACRLAGWLAGPLAVSLAGSLAGPLAGSLARCLARRLTGWLAGRLAGLLAGSLAGSLLARRLARWLSHWLADWPTGWLAVSLAAWLTGWLAGSLTA